MVLGLELAKAMTKRHFSHTPNYQGKKAMSQLDTLPRLTLDGMVGTTDERGFTYIAPNIHIALLLGWDDDECWRVFQEKTGLIIQIDPNGSTSVVYQTSGRNECLAILRLIHERNYRHLVRSVGRTQCRRWGLSV